VKYDNLLKTIFLDAMPGMLRALRCAPVKEYLNVEFPSRPKMIADVVARLLDGKILHLEFQLSNDPRMHWRCYHYFGAIQEQWEDSEVIQIVIYLGNPPLQMRSEIQKPSLAYRYEIVDMREIDASVFLQSPGDSERVLALLCQSPDPRATIREVLASWKHLSDKVLLENIERLKTLSHLRGIEIIATEEIERMPFDLDITESLFYKQALVLAEAACELAGEARLLVRQLESVFGPLPDHVRARINQGSVDQIEEWGIRMLHARSLDEIFSAPPE
jgi:hypothetical protein